MEAAMSKLAYAFVCAATVIVLATVPCRAEHVDVDIHPTGTLAELLPGASIGDITFRCKEHWFRKCTISEYMEYAHVCALLVVKGQQIRLEQYRRARKPGEKDEKCWP